MVPRLPKPHQEASQSLPARCLGRSRHCAFVAACPEGGNLWVEEAESTPKMLCVGRPPEKTNSWASAPTALARPVLTWPNTCHFPLQGKEDRRAESDRAPFGALSRPGLEASFPQGGFKRWRAIMVINCTRVRPPSFSRSRQRQGSSSPGKTPWRSCVGRSRYARPRPTGGGRIASGGGRGHQGVVRLSRHRPTCRWCQHAGKTRPSLETRPYKIPGSPWGSVVALRPSW